MPSPQEILSDPNFLGLPVGEQLKVMRTVDPNFAALPPKEQGTVIAKSKLKSLGYDKIGQNIADDPNMGTSEISMEPGLPGQPSKDLIGGAKDIASGNIARGAHSVLTGAGKLGTMLVPEAAVAAPLATFGSLALGYGGSKAAKAAAEGLGTSPDVANLAGDAGGLVAGVGGAKFGDRGLRSMGNAIKIPEWSSRIRSMWNDLGERQSLRGESAAAGRRMQQRLGGPATPAPESYKPLSPSGRPLTEDEIAFEANRDQQVFKPLAAPPSERPIPGVKPAPSTAQKLPAWHMIRDQVRESPGPAEVGISPKNRLPRPKTPVPASSAPVDAPGVSEGAKSAAELMKTVGIDVAKAGSATPAQWQMIEQQVGQPFDRQQAIQHLAEISKSKIPGKPQGYESGPKTPVPDRAAAHAETLGKFLRKTKVRPEDVPTVTDDAAWNLLEKQTGTVAPPAVRAAAIEANRKLWAESQADLQTRRAAHFNSEK